jgi:hypothetical protein
VKGIVDIGQSLIGAGRGLLDLSRALHAQSFVRTFVIEDFDEVVEASLLLKEVGSGRQWSYLMTHTDHTNARSAILAKLSSLATEEIPARAFGSVKAWKAYLKHRDE